MRHRSRFSGAAPQVEVRAGGLGFAEGPVYLRNGDVVVVSLDHGCVYRIDAAGPHVLADLGGSPNGAAECPDGSLVVTQNGGHVRGARRRPSPGGLQLVAADGAVSWLSQDLVAPNDLCFGPDAMLYVTDPTRQMWLDDGRIWRCDPTTGQCEILCSVPWFPNGIAFGTADDAVFVASTREGLIYRFPLDAGRLGRPEPFCDLRGKAPDGLAFGVDGYLLVAAVGHATTPGEVQLFAPDGSMVDKIHLGNSRYYTNLALNPSSPELLVTDADRGELLAVPWSTKGLVLHPFR